MVRPPAARSAVPSVGRLGLLEPDAGALLTTLGWDNADGVDVLWALSRAPDADLALQTLVRLRHALGADWAELDTALRADTRLRGRLFGLVGSSIAFADHLVADPAAWRLLRAEAMPHGDELTADMLAAVDATPAGYTHRAGVTGVDAVAALRKRYRDHLMLLAALDLAATVENEPTMPYRRVAHALTDLADAALAAAFAVAVATAVPADRVSELPRVAVVAMGKCGGRELNYVSDVDVVFVAEPADDTARRIAAEFMRIGKAAFFEVDAGLRPEGRQGALVRTLDSHVVYYQRWAKTWEFQALLKARPMTGDMDLGRAYCEALMPMVWKASERKDFVSEVQQMRTRVENSIPEKLRDRELKLGQGGLRDVEFAVQLLQLVHGRADESLRVPDTVETLQALAAGGYVGREDAANLTA
ncbi:MAG: bifunctional [glutamine synthetase] adenylyltransferase/[glutamine synthetase]-adenylyl-L-tyrosine phosphorylase, partial [Mycobacteriaceae bacterium]|nr:bifunctional [glutamine synthetase] adenylyltransferase/[glutamine synthetase]-adenylyl-L-tyrosine phosphorylase [Mycobacteriaceae bacterium]